MGPHSKAEPHPQIQIDFPLSKCQRQSYRSHWRTVTSIIIPVAGCTINSEGSRVAEYGISWYTRLKDRREDELGSDRLNTKMERVK